MTVNVAAGLTPRARDADELGAARLLQGATPALLLLGALAWSVAALLARPALAAPAPFRVPVASAQLLAELPAGSPVFCSVRYGGYLAWALDGRVRPYIDGRLVLRSPELFARYLELLDEPARFESLQAAHGFAAAVLPAAKPDRYLGLIAHLARHPDWTLTYTDGSEVLFERTDLSARPALELARPAEVDRVRAELARRHGDPRTRARALLHLGRLLALLGHLDRAEELLVVREEAAAQRLLARIYLMHGKMAAAEALAARLLAAEPRDAEARAIMEQLARQGVP